MKPYPSEKELYATLDAGRKLIVDCIHGRINFNAFLTDYDAFYIQHNLDGHESDDAEKAILRKHATEIALHQAVWENVISKVTADEFMNRPEVLQAGFIGHSEAQSRLKDLVRKYSI